VFVPTFGKNFLLESLTLLNFVQLQHSESNIFTLKFEVASSSETSEQSRCSNQCKSPQDHRVHWGIPKHICVKFDTVSTSRKHAE